MSGELLALGTVAALAVAGATRRARSMRPEQATFLRQKLDRFVADNPSHRPLFDRLLSIGGGQVVATFEPDLTLLLERGEFYDGAGADLVLGEPCRCHDNAVRMWLDDPDRYVIETGWALSPDGLWRQHSWVYDTSNERIVETTELRTLYFGVTLNYDEAARFTEDQIG